MLTLEGFKRYQAKTENLSLKLPVWMLHRLTLERWYTNLEQTPLDRCQQLPTPYKRLIRDENETDKRTSNRPTQF